MAKQIIKIAGNTTTGSGILYTCPAGKAAKILPRDDYAIHAAASSGYSVNFLIRNKVVFTASGTTSSTVLANITDTISPILMPGETIQYSNTGKSFSYDFLIIEEDN